MSLFSDRILSGRWGLFCLLKNQSAEGEQKVFVHLFQKVVGFKRAKPFDALRRVRNFIRVGAFSEV